MHLRLPKSYYYLRHISVIFAITAVFWVSLPTPSLFAIEKTDSLKRLLNSSRDTNEVKLLLQISEELKKTATDSSLKFAEKAFEKATKLNYTKGIAGALSAIGSASFEKGDFKKSKSSWQTALQLNIKSGNTRDAAYNYLNLGHLFNNFYQVNYDSCIRFYNLALETFTKLKDHKGLGLVYNGLAIKYYFDGNNDNSLKMYKKALAEFTAIKDNDGIGNALNNIALVYIEEGDYVPALDYLHQASFYYEKAKNTIQMANNANSIGSLYMRLFDYKNAEKYLKKALTFFEKLNNPLYLSMVHDNFGSFYHSIGNHSKALEHYFKGHQYDLQAGNDYYVAFSLDNIASVLKDQGKLDSALHYCNESIKKARAGEYYPILSSSLITLAYIQKELGKTDDAIKTGEEAAKLLSSLEIREKIKELAELLSELYAQKKNYKKAYEFQKLLKNTTDSLLNAEKIRTITGKEYEYNFAKKQREQDLAKKQQKLLHVAELSHQKTIRNFWIAIAVVLSILMVLVYRNYHQKQKDNKLLNEKNEIINQSNLILNKQKVELTEANSTKDKFFSIIAHDLKNPLNAMIGFSDLLESNFDTLDPAVQKKYIRLINQSSNDLFKLLENLLQWSRLQTGSIAFNPSRFFLIDAVNPILSLLEASALKKNISIHNTIGKNIPVFGDYAMLTTILRNLLSNAIKFTPDYGSIYIECEETDNAVRIIIRDTGIGLNASELKKIFRTDVNFSKKGTSGEKGTGMGLILCKEFVEKNNGEIGVISKEGEGASFWFTMKKDKE